MGAPDITYRRELLTLSDGSTVALDWPQSDDSLPADAPIVVLKHGLCGNSQSIYILHMVEQCKKLG
jgi:predicted alpha/beta-fold hydrolase